ncbi:hypothetical protein EVAR_84826_1 [Eumeta japonica]|uniref:Uncharacterized protein n=1 Tax=Eumeta variegata TaxID=151549 RepID=A0A4C1U9L5_EUMVA|nr:hypothetical protein EVAR_84826_1 [Eumeta japonica]
MRTLLSIWSADFLRCGGDQMMDSVFSDFFIKPSFTRRGHALNLHMHWLSRSLARGASTPLVVGAGTGRRTYCCLMPGRLLVGDTTPTVLWLWFLLRESSQTSSSRRFCFTKWEEAFS